MDAIVYEKHGARGSVATYELYIYNILISFLFFHYLLM